MRILIPLFVLLSLCIKTQAQSFTLVPYEEERLDSYEDSILTNKNIRIVTSVSFGEDGEGDVNMLSKSIALELIDRKLFEKKRKTAVTFILGDPTVKIANGVIMLPVRDSIVTFEDNIVDDETHRIYSFIGQAPAIGQYVVAGLYWETMDVMFIDKQTGKQTAVFIDYPFIAPDKKHIISIYANPYDTASDVSVDVIGKKGIENKLNTSFRNWMPYMDQAFYSSDGWLYFPANHFDRYWDKTGDINSEYQYMRIKAL